jgi:hypothetical protein
MKNSNIVSKMLKAGLAAVTFIKACEAVVSDADKLAYPEFALAMETACDNLDWKSYQVTTTDGFILTVWRITMDNMSIPDAARGPVLLEHGFYSDGLSWMERDDVTSVAYPCKLA